MKPTTHAKPTTRIIEISTPKATIAPTTVLTTPERTSIIITTIKPNKSTAEPFDRPQRVQLECRWEASPCSKSCGGCGQRFYTRMCDYSDGSVERSV